MRKSNLIRNKKIVFLVLIFLLSLNIMTSCNKENDGENVNKNISSGETDGGESLETDEPTEPKTEEATEPETTEPEISQLTLAMVGDMLLHMYVQKTGYMPDGSLNYDHIFVNIKDEIKNVDIAIANQEVLLGGLELGLSGYPAFNAAYEFGDALVDAGFNVVLHATNHTLDKGKKGLMNCFNYWNTNHPDIAVLGINESQEAQDNDIYVYEKDGIKVAILNYTYGTNGIPLPKDMPYAVNLIDKAKMEKDIIKANKIADFIVVTPHWGNEYQHHASSYQKDYAEFMAELGVDLVIGTHPHVVQPVEWIEAENGNRMLVYYSIGNYINSTASKGKGVSNRMVGAMAKVTIEKKEGQAYIKEYSAIPLISHKGEGTEMTVYKLDDYTVELALKNMITTQDKDFSYEYLRVIWNDVYPEFVY